MCGIAGIVGSEGRPSSMEELQRMCEVIAHRGPNDCGYYFDTHAALGMRRLSIIDLETGRQPVRNEDGSIWTVFNGEIYNYKQLRREMKRRGHRFYTTSDTEVIVHLYEEYGTDCVKKLRGMFAFAVWDQTRRQLTLARDRLGIKPLYYTFVRGRLIFASELKSILEIEDVPREISWRGMNRLFTFLSTPQDQSIIEGVHKLQPGHLLVAPFGLQPRVERYWEVHFHPDRSQPEEFFVERLRDLLEESVRLHMMSDVPLGAFLSGGIDSSSVVATISKVSGNPVKTFSIGFAEDDYSELTHARRIAKQFGTDHHELIIEPDVLDVLEDITWYLDEPFGDSSAIPTYMVSRLASQHVTVVLSGDGGDEIFAGYDKYRVERRERAYRFVPPPARAALRMMARMMPDGMRGRNFLHHIALPGVERYLDSSTLFRHAQMRRLFKSEVYRKLSQYDPWAAEMEMLTRYGDHWLSALQYLDLNTYLPLDILTKVDRMSMANSIEARVPLLDHQIVEFAATIPPEMQLGQGQTKHIFKRAMRGILPDELIDRRKQGFAIPLGRWFRGQLSSFVRDLLLSERSLRRGLLEPTYIERLIRRHERGRDLDMHLWTLISFELWCRAFLDMPTHRRVSGSSERKKTPINLRAAS